MTINKDNYFFYGVVKGEVPEDSWQALHDHFEKLAREDDERPRETVITERRAVKRKEGNRE